MVLAVEARISFRIGIRVFASRAPSVNVYHLQVRVDVPMIVAPSLFGPLEVTVTGVGAALMHVATP
jgi:hypothetical protein